MTDDISQFSIKDQIRGLVEQLRLLYQIPIDLEKRESRP